MARGCWAPCSASVASSCRVLGHDAAASLDPMLSRSWARRCRVLGCVLCWGWFGVRCALAAPPSREPLILSSAFVERLCRAPGAIRRLDASGVCRKTRLRANTGDVEPAQPSHGNASLRRNKAQPWDACSWPANALGNPGKPVGSGCGPLCKRGSPRSHRCRREVVQSLHSRLRLDAQNRDGTRDGEDRHRLQASAVDGLRSELADPISRRRSVPPRAQSPAGGDDPAGPATPPRRQSPAAALRPAPPAGRRPQRCRRWPAGRQPPVPRGCC